MADKLIIMSDKDFTKLMQRTINQTIIRVLRCLEDIETNPAKTDRWKYIAAVINDDFLIADKLLNKKKANGNDTRQDTEQE